MNKSLWYLYVGSVAGCVAAANPWKSNLYAYRLPCTLVMIFLSQQYLKRNLILKKQVQLQSMLSHCLAIAAIEPFCFCPIFYFSTFLCVPTIEPCCNQCEQLVPITLNRKANSFFNAIFCATLSLVLTDRYLLLFSFFCSATVLYFLSLQLVRRRCHIEWPVLGSLMLINA